MKGLLGHIAARFRRQDGVQRRPTNIIPIGRPSAIPHGRLMAGRPVTLKGQVLRVGSQLRRVISCGVAFLAGIGVAFIGTLGSSRRS